MLCAYVCICVLVVLYTIIMLICLFFKVASLQKTLIEWRDQVDSLRQKYTWLLFFSVPKALHLYSLLDDLEFDLDSIVREISFLFENSSSVREKLKRVVKVTELGVVTPLL